MTTGDPVVDGEASGLSPRQERFVREYAKCGNAKRAAILAGYSARSAKQIGSALMRRPVVREAVNGLRCAGQPPGPDLTPEWALQQLVEETADPNPRVRLDAKKAVAQAVGAFARKDDHGPQECARCRRLRAVEGLSTEELELVMAGSDKQRVVAMSHTRFLEWATGVTAQAERWIEIARGFRGEGVGISELPGQDLAHPAPSQGPSGQPPRAGADLASSKP